MAMQVRGDLPIAAAPPGIRAVADGAHGSRRSFTGLRPHRMLLQAVVVWRHPTARAPQRCPPGSARAGAAPLLSAAPEPAPAPACRCFLVKSTFVVSVDRAMLISIALSQRRIAESFSGKAGIRADGTRADRDRGESAFSPSVARAPAGCPAAATAAPVAAAEASAIFRSALAARLWKGISEAGGVSRYRRGPATRVRMRRPDSQLGSGLSSRMRL